MKPPELDIDPAGWWMSEKFDGWFLRWDGARFTTANGNAVKAPAWFSAGLPVRELHGELYAGPGAFDSIAGIVASGRGWERLSFAIFRDVSTRFPGVLHDFTYAPHAFTVRQQPCVSREHLESFYADVIARGGEGVMLRLADTLIKLKPSDDEEAEVVAHASGTRGFGVGSIIVRNARGTFGLAGMSDAVRCNPPPVGVVVTFRFSGVTAKGIPKCARYLRQRPAATLKLAA